MADHPDRTPQDEDVEAHMPYKMRRDEEPPTDKPMGAEPHGDDVEGHVAKGRSPLDAAEPRR